MAQAHIQALIFEVRNLKSEITNYMSTTELEKQNLKKPFFYEKNTRN